MGSSPRGHKELDMTEATEHAHMHHVIYKIYAEDILYRFKECHSTLISISKF